MEQNLEHIASLDNLLAAWCEFSVGKTTKPDVQRFKLRLMDNIISLHNDIVNGSYRHGGYHAFNISDPKPRNIHKANVRDRLVHHAVYRVLSPYFDRTFIADSYSCRAEKGTHAALKRFRAFAYRASHNHTRTCWVLKCDIRKFFASIDHGVLLKILPRHIQDDRVLTLLREIVESFSVPGRPGIGLPLGNLTSQLLVNIYMNEFDQFVKHSLRVPCYIRYADDFVILSTDRNYLEDVLSKMDVFLSGCLHLELHPEKVSLATLASGVDFLGWVHFPDHHVLRTVTKRRMLKKLTAQIVPAPATLASYRGLLKHGNARKLLRMI